MTGVPYFKNMLERELLVEQKFGNHTLKYTQQYICQFLQQTGVSAIFDRFYPDEWVYGIVYNRDIDPVLFWDLDKQFAKIPVRIVICEKDDDAEYADALVDRDTMLRVKRLYHHFAALTNCPHLIINTTHRTPDENAAVILDWLKHDIMLDTPLLYLTQEGDVICQHRLKL